MPQIERIGYLAEEPDDVVVRKTAPCLRRHADPAPDVDGCTHAGQERVDAGKARPWTQRQDGYPHGHKGDGTRRQLRPCVPEHRKPFDRQKTADQEFPGAWRAHEERIRGSAASHQPDGERERGKRQRSQTRRQNDAVASSHHEQGPDERRQHQVKLLFDRQRPGVQQRFFDRGMIEIAALQPEEEVRRERHDGCNRAKQFRAFRRQQIMERRDRGQRHHHVKRGQQATDAPLVEARQGKRAVLRFRLDDPGDEVSRDHEEDIDADEAAEIGRRLEVVKQHHRQHGNGAQPVDVFAVIASHDRSATRASNRDAMRSRRDFHRPEIRRQDDLQELNVVGVIQDHVPDLRRLGPAAALLHRGLALAFHVGLDPALEHIDHLEFDVVIVELRHFLGIARPLQADDMRLRQAMRRVLDAEVAVMRVGAQAVGLEILFAVMADGDALLRPRLCFRCRRAAALRLDGLACGSLCGGSRARPFLLHRRACRRP